MEIIGQLRPDWPHFKKGGDKGLAAPKQVWTRNNPAEGFFQHVGVEAPTMIVKNSERHIRSEKSCPLPDMDEN